MNNIEKLAIEHLNKQPNPDADEGGFYYGLLSDLEAFAKALQQSSEPVAWRQKIEVLRNGLTNVEWAYSDFQVMVNDTPLFTHPPASVPLEKYNKLLDALRDQVGAKDRAGWLGEIDDMLFSMLDDEQYTKVSREINGAKSEGLQAIAEAEGKEG